MAGICSEQFWRSMQVSCAARARHIFFQSPNGQVVTELHTEDLRASGPLEMLREILKTVGSHVAIKSTIFPAGEKRNF